MVPLNRKRFCRQGCLDDLGTPAVLKGPHCRHRRTDAPRKRRRVNASNVDRTEMTITQSDDTSTYSTTPPIVFMPAQVPATCMVHNSVQDASQALMNYVQHAGMAAPSLSSPRNTNTGISQASSLSVGVGEPFIENGTGSEGQSGAPDDLALLLQDYTAEARLNLLEALGLVVNMDGERGVEMEMGLPELPCDEELGLLAMVEVQGAAAALTVDPVSVGPAYNAESDVASSLPAVTSKPRAIYIDDDRKRSKVHSACCARLLEYVESIQTRTRPYIFLFVARPETVLAANGKAFTYTSPGLKAVFKNSQRDIACEIYEMTKAHAQAERLTVRDITVLNMQVQNAEAEHARQLAEERDKAAAVLAEERAKTAAALAELAQVRQAVNQQ